mmetsp:Transcript_42571/g.92554  ORF Transcript_42571/g.92554 Transcript_42571/m.92554 type:complete len:439 (-) Transcript_42571:13-1329(-)
MRRPRHAGGPEAGLRRARRPGGRRGEDHGHGGRGVPGRLLRRQGPRALPEHLPALHAGHGGPPDRQEPRQELLGGRRRPVPRGAARHRVHQGRGRGRPADRHLLPEVLAPAVGQAPGQRRRHPTRALGLLRQRRGAADKPGLHGRGERAVHEARGARREHPLRLRRPGRLRPLGRRAPGEVPPGLPGRLALRHLRGRHGLRGPGRHRRGGGLAGLWRRLQRPLRRAALPAEGRGRLPGPGRLQGRPACGAPLERRRARLPRRGGARGPQERLLRGRGRRLLRRGGHLRELPRRGRRRGAAERPAGGAGSAAHGLPQPLHLPEPDGLPGRAAGREHRRGAPRLPSPGGLGPGHGLRHAELRGARDGGAGGGRGRGAEPPRRLRAAAASANDAAGTTPTIRGNRAHDRGPEGEASPSPLLPAARLIPDRARREAVHIVRA